MSVFITSEEIFVSEIKIGKRLRKEIGNIDSLCKSINSIGLLHPIIITSDNYLVSGQRRFEAIKKLGWTAVPARKIDFKHGVQHD